MTQQLNPTLESNFAQWEKLGPSGDAEHKARLSKLAGAIRQQLASSTTKKADLVFVCTHNSRRSHMAQLLSLAAARRRGLSEVRTFSGGTEATAFNPRAIAALKRVGFEITPAAAAINDATKNPHQTVRFSASADPVDTFSKRYGDPPNPTSGFIVVMTCSQADQACPMVDGAIARIAVPYDDPKVADDTPEETDRYDERVAQIGRDLTWVFAEVSSAR
jgi:arsenate reductase (thioredoxin)